MGDEFLAIPAFDTGHNPTSGVSGDFDKDGKADIAIANIDGIMIFLTNESSSLDLLSYRVEGNPAALAIGAALYVYHRYTREHRRYLMRDAYLCPAYSNQNCIDTLNEFGLS